MQAKKVFVTGMFRSGTTLLARALNAHQEIIFAADPFFEFFKHLRNKYYSQKKEDFNKAQPLGDKFLEDNRFNNKFTNDFLEIKLDSTDSDIFFKSIAKAAKPFSPRVIPLLGKVELNKEQTAKQVLYNLIALLPLAYPKDSPAVVGFKEVWLEEFIKPLIVLPDFYAIQIIRDPRAVIASKKKSATGGYPLLFLIRQWRKGVAYSIINQGNKRYLQIKFENLIENPEKIFLQLCDFLQIDYSNDLVDFSKFKDGAGKQWFQNSSFKSSKKFNKANAEKWKEILSTQ